MTSHETCDRPNMRSNSTILFIFDDLYKSLSLRCQGLNHTVCFIHTHATEWTAFVYTYIGKYVKENGGLDFAAEKYSGCAVLNEPENGYPIVQQQGKLVPQFSENCFCDKLLDQYISLSRPPLSCQCC